MSDKAIGKTAPQPDMAAIQHKLMVAMETLATDRGDEQAAKAANRVTAECRQELRDWRRAGTGVAKPDEGDINLTPESPLAQTRKYAKTKGIGSVYQRGETWWISYSVNGVRERESSKSENRADAVRLLKDRLGSMGRHEPVGAAINRTTLGEIQEILLTDYAAIGSKSARYAEGGFRRLFRYFKPHQKAASITAAELKSYVAAAKERGYKPATIGYDLAVLRHGYRLARDAGKVGVVPKFPTLRFRNARKGFLTVPEYRILRNELPEELGPVLTVAYACGWRVKSELLTRKVKHVDLRESTLRLDAGETKNGEARIFVFRGLPEVEAAITALVQSALPATAPGVTALRPDPEAWLFRRPNGCRIRNFRDAWNSACKRAGVERLVHDLRRSAIRNMVRSGTPDLVCMKISGHLSHTVFERYNITSQEDLIDAASRLAAFHTREMSSVTVMTQSAPETPMTAEKTR